MKKKGPYPYPYPKNSEVKYNPVEIFAYFRRPTGLRCSAACWAATVQLQFGVLVIGAFRAVFQSTAWIENRDLHRQSHTPQHPADPERRQPKKKSHLRCGPSPLRHPGLRPPRPANADETACER